MTELRTIETSASGGAPETAGRPAPPALPPGPRWPALVQTWHLVRRPWPFLAECARRYGDCFTARLVGLPPTVLVSDPDAIRDLLQADPADVVAGEFNARYFEPALGRYSLLNLDGPRHLRERRLLLPPFHGERIHVTGRTCARSRRRRSRAGPSAGRSRCSTR